MLSQIAEYLEWKKTTKLRAGESYKKALTRFAKFLDNKNMALITKGDVLKFQNYLKEELPKLSKRGTWVSNYWFHLTVLKNFFRYWWEERICVVRPSFIEVPKIKYNPYHALTQEEFEMIDDYLESEPENFANLQKRFIHNFLYDTGVRVSELVELNWTQFTHENCILIQNKKNKESGWVFWSPKTHILLLLFLQQRKLYKGDWLLATINGRMNKRTVQHFLRTLGETISLPFRLHPHCYRHGKAHKLLDLGADIKTVKDALRHTSYQSTERYTLLSKQENQKRQMKYLT